MKDQVMTPKMEAALEKIMNACDRLTPAAQERFLGMAEMLELMTRDKEEGDEKSGTDNRC